MVLLPCNRGGDGVRKRCGWLGVGLGSGGSGGVAWWPYPGVPVPSSGAVVGDGGGAIGGDGGFCGAVALERAAGAKIDLLVHPNIINKQPEIAVLECATNV